jgi:hypothetical protein
MGSVITTCAASLAQLCKSLLERFSSYGRTTAASRQKCPILVGPRLRWHYRILYLRELKRELCNVYHRMGILRGKHLCQIGTTLLSTYEGAKASHRRRRRIEHVHSLGIQKLQTILPTAVLPTAVLVDLHLLIESLRCHQFEFDSFPIGEAVDAAIRFR